VESCVGGEGSVSGLGFLEVEELIVSVVLGRLWLGLRSWMSTWKIRRSKFSICLLASILQKLRKSCRPTNLWAATRMASMSSRPSVLRCCLGMTVFASCLVGRVGVPALGAKAG